MVEGIQINNTEQSLVLALFSSLAKQTPGMNAYIFSTQEAKILSIPFMICFLCFLPEKQYQDVGGTDEGGDKEDVPVLGICFMVNLKGLLLEMFRSQLQQQQQPPPPQQQQHIHMYARVFYGY